MKSRRPMHYIRVFTDKYPFIGPLVYTLSLQYFVAQPLVASAWQPVAYSFRNNAISDLGSTACGNYFNRYVCSPDHALMNASFIMLGLTMALGSLLIYHEFKRSRDSLIGFGLMGLAGLGSVLVGLFPENTILPLHALGAALALGGGNISLVVLSLAIKDARFGFRIYGVISGVISLVALALFTAHIFLGIGEGGMERIVSYPQTLWLVLFGIYMTATRVRARRATTA